MGRNLHPPPATTSTALHSQPKQSYVTMTDSVDHSLWLQRGLGTQETSVFVVVQFQCLESFFTIILHQWDGATSGQKDDVLLSCMWPRSAIHAVGRVGKYFFFNIWNVNNEQIFNGFFRQSGVGSARWMETSGETEFHKETVPGKTQLFERPQKLIICIGTMTI